MVNNENKKLFRAFSIILEVVICVPLLVAFTQLITKNITIYCAFCGCIGILFGLIFSVIEKYFYE